MSVRLMLIFFVMFLGALSSPAQSPVQEVGDEKEPELRKELVRMVTEDQNTRGEFDRFRKEHGLMVDLVIAHRMQQGDEKRTFRLKEIVATYGWPGRSLVGSEAEGAAYLLIAHAVKDSATGAPDVAFQRLSLDLMSKMPPCEVENTHLASLTDRVLLYEGKKQMYGIMLTRNEKGEKVPQPIEDEANVDKRRAKLGLQPLAEYLRRSGATAEYLRRSGATKGTQKK